MYIFNPEHDLCLANGDIHFVPPQSALDFGRDCALLTHFMRGLDLQADYDDPVPMKIVPWGWNSVLRDRLLKEGYSPQLMPSNDTLAAIRELSDRRVALKALEYLNQRFFCSFSKSATGKGGVKDEERESIFTEPGYRIAAESLSVVKEFLEREQNVVLKAPLSGSGKGIRFVANALSHSDEGWCSNLVKRHGCVVVERRFSPVLEFAMLFKCAGPDEGGRVMFVGYSLFYTQNGMYKGNILASDEWIENEILKYIPRVKLALAKEFLMEFLRENIAARYEGFVGVDQFVYLPFDGRGDLFGEINHGEGNCGEGYRSAAEIDCTAERDCSAERDCTAERDSVKNQYRYNPVVEINLRMTMGLIAHNIYMLREGIQGAAASEAIPEQIKDGSHYFEIIRGKKGSKEGYSYIIAPTGE